MMFKSFIRWILNIKLEVKQLNCEHNYKRTMFQALTDDATYTYECTKCGKMTRF